MKNLEKSTAIVKFMGLGIMCFNPKKKRCETLLIHNPKHIPMIKVFLKEELNGENAREVDGQMMERKLSHFYIPLFGMGDNKREEALTIEISGVGKSEIDGYRKYEAKKFDRQSLESDPHDYRWVVNLEQDNLIADGKKIRISNKSKEITGKSNLYIKNAEFFTYDLVKPDPNKSKSKEPQFFCRRKFVDSGNKKGATQAIEWSKYGYVANWVGARINAEFVKIKITAGSEESIHLLPKRKVPYLIEIENSTYDAGSESDMPIYQGFWKTKDQNQVDLLIKSELEKEHMDRGLTFDGGGIPIGTRRTCYLVASHAKSTEDFK